MSQTPMVSDLENRLSEKLRGYFVEAVFVWNKNQIFQIMPLKEFVVLWMKEKEKEVK